MSHRRPGGDVVLLEDVNLTLQQGSFYVLIGTSGGGKSSLLRLGL